MHKLNLLGKRVVITRALHQVDDIARQLENRGAIPLLYPCLELLPPDELTPLHQALENLIYGGYDWVIFTSQNTVTVLAEVLKKLKTPIECAAVGTATAQAVTELGLTVTTLPESHTAEALAAAMPPIHGAQILLPQSALADKSLAMALVERGAHITAVTAYTMGVGKGGIDLPAQLRAKTIDAITVASPSAFDNLLTRLKNEGGDSADLHDVVLACIGSTTAQALQDHGFTPTVTAHTHTIGGMIDALAAYFTAQETPHS